MINQADTDLSVQLQKDFSRNTWCVLGLPFDEVTMGQAVDEVVLAITEKRFFFVSTPNLNFLCAAQTDQDFKHSVINSDLSVADGMPIVVVAKLLKIPITERVAGSDLINRLSEAKTEHKIKVFFLGGEPEVAKTAHTKLNALDNQLISVGYLDPGFVSVDKMSTDDIISTINQQEIDFLIVSLGAKKGQAWIEKNKDRLSHVSAISHLGAVVNFFAGTVKRSPVWMQKSGLEWFWRIYQEPALWKRYAADGFQFLKLLCFNVLPYWIWLTLKKSSNLNDLPAQLSITHDSDNLTTITLSGHCLQNNNLPLRDAFIQGLLNKTDIIIDLETVKDIDGHFLGLCLLLQKYTLINKKSLQLINASKEIKKIARWNCVGYLFN